MPFTPPDPNRVDQPVLVICYHKAGCPPKEIRAHEYKGQNTLCFLGLWTFTELTEFPDASQELYDVFQAKFVPIFTFGHFPTRSPFSPFYITKPASLAAADCIDLGRYIKKLLDDAGRYPCRIPSWMDVSPPAPTPINTPRLAYLNKNPEPPRPLKRKRVDSWEETVAILQEWQCNKAGRSTESD